MEDKKDKKVLLKIGNWFMKYGKYIIGVLVVIDLFIFKDALEHMLTPYPRLTTILGMALTLSIAFINFRKDDRKELQRSENLNVRVRKNLIKDYVSHEQGLKSIKYNLEEIKKHIRNNEELTKANKLSDAVIYPDFIDSLTALLTNIQDYEISTYFESLSENLSDEITSVVNIDLKDERKNELNKLKMNVDSFIFNVLQNSERLSTYRVQNIPNYYKEIFNRKRDSEVFEEFFLVMFLTDIIKDYETALEQVESIIKFFNESTEKS